MDQFRIIGGLIAELELRQETTRQERILPRYRHRRCFVRLHEAKRVIWLKKFSMSGEERRFQFGDFSKDCTRRLAGSWLFGIRRPLEPLSLSRSPRASSITGDTVVNYHPSSNSHRVRPRKNTRTADSPDAGLRSPREIGTVSLTRMPPGKVSPLHHPTDTMSIFFAPAHAQQLRRESAINVLCQDSHDFSFP